MNESERLREAIDSIIYFMKRGKCLMDCETMFNVAAVGVGLSMESPIIISFCEARKISLKHIVKFLENPKWETSLLLDDLHESNAEKKEDTEAERTRVARAYAHRPFAFEPLKSESKEVVAVALPECEPQLSTDKKIPKELLDE